MPSAPKASERAKWPVRLASIVLATILLSFPVLLNGAPFLFPDSDAYYRAGRSVITTVLGGKEQGEPAPGAAAKSGESAAVTADAPAVAAPSPNHNMDLTLWLARSPHYGTLLYLTAMGGGLWGIVFLQALVAATVIWRAASAFAGDDPLKVFWVMIVTAALGSTLPWYAGFVMPDVWLSLALLYLAAVMFGARRPTLTDYAMLAVLAGAAAGFHTSNLAVLAIAIPLAVIVAAAFGVTSWRGGSIIAATVLAGYVGALLAWWVFGFAVEKKYGARLNAPIFATARVLADGPGRAYLRTACAHDPARYQLCKFRELPLDNSDAIIWSDDPGLGVYTVSDYDTRVALSREQWPFVIATVLYDPLGVASAALGNGLTQVTRFSLAEFGNNRWATWSGNPYWGQQAIFEALPGAAVCLSAPASCAPPAAVAAFDAAQRLVLAVALAFLVWSVWRLEPWRAETADLDRRLGAFAAFVLLGFFVNAAVCGALAGPIDRYESRLSWLIPTAAALIAALRWSALRRTAPVHS